MGDFKKSETFSPCLGTFTESCDKTARGHTVSARTAQTVQLYIVKHSFVTVPKKKERKTVPSSLKFLELSSDPSSDLSSDLILELKSVQDPRKSKLDPVLVPIKFE